MKMSSPAEFFADPEPEGGYWLDVAKAQAADDLGRL